MTLRQVQSHSELIESMKIALVYDRVNKWGGAERVLLALHKIFPNAPLYTSVYNKEKAPWADKFEIKTSFLQNFPFAKSFHEAYALLMPLAFESFSFDEYDVVISVTSEAAKGIITKPGTLHICYCLTPTRYLWSGFNEYFKNPLINILSYPFISYLKTWDKAALQRPDCYLAISTDVKERIKKYYGKDSKVIFPPVEIQAPVQPAGQASNYFLVVSRLVPYKRVDLAIKACNELGLNLKIVGSGVKERELKKIANFNIEFLKDLTDEKLSYYYKNCKALIFPGREDFGLAMAEAQSFGKPVIAFRGGGALDIIKEGQTGEFFEKQTVSSLKKALENFKSNRYNINLSIKNSERFSFERFEKDLRDFINTV